MVVYLFFITLLIMSFVSDPTPSEASYSRLITKLEESKILEVVQEQVITQAISEGFIMDDTIAIDATPLKPVTRHRQRKKIIRTKSRKNGAENPKKSVKSGSLNKPKKKRICPFLKRKLRLNWTLLFQNCVRKFRRNRSGALKRTVKASMCFGLAIRAI